MPDRSAAASGAVAFAGLAEGRADHRAGECAQGHGREAARLDQGGEVLTQGDEARGMMVMVR